MITHRYLLTVSFFLFITILTLLIPTSLLLIMAILALCFFFKKSYKETLPINKTNSILDTPTLPSIEVVVPVKNEASTIKNTIDKIFASDFPKQKLKVTVINDHSTDETADIITSLMNTYKNLSLYNRQKTSGLKAGALNEAFHSFSEKIILFMDANATISSQTIQNSLKYMISNNIRALQLERVIKTEHATIISALIRLYYKFFNDSVASDLTSPLYGSGMFIYKSDIDKCGGWSENQLIEDADMSQKLYMQNIIVRFYGKEKVYKAVSGSIKTFFFQQYRWHLGFVMLLSTYLPNLLTCKFDTLHPLYFFICTHAILSIMTIILLISGFFIGFSWLLPMIVLLEFIYVFIRSMYKLNFSDDFYDVKNPFYKIIISFIAIFVPILITILFVLAYLRMLLPMDDLKWISK